MEGVAALLEAATFDEVAIAPYSPLGPQQLALVLPAFLTQMQLLVACPVWLTI